MGRGLTARQVLRLARDFQDQVKVEKYAGQSHGQDSWTELGTFSGFLKIGARATFGPGGIVNDYDAEIYVLGNESLTVIEPGTRLKLTVVEYKGERQRLADGTEADPAPVVKRTTMYESSDVAEHKDLGGDVVFVVFRGSLIRGQ